MATVRLLEPLTSEMYEALIQQIKAKRDEDIVRLQNELRSSNDRIQRDTESFIADRAKLIKESSDWQKLYFVSESENIARRGAKLRDMEQKRDGNRIRQARKREKDGKK